MKIVISDYPDTLKQRNIQYEVGLLQKAFPAGEIMVVPYEGTSEFTEALREADALLTAFVPVTDELLRHCPNLRCISINATGYDTVDIKAASRQGVAVCCINEYCTEDVADFTLALLLALSKKLKAHQYYVEQEHRWQYQQVGSVLRLRGKTLAIFGFGRIGRAVAARAEAFGMKVLAVDPFPRRHINIPPSVTLVDTEDACRHAHFISNHMMATKQNVHFFNDEFFKKLRQQPVFLNTGRAETVDEAALIRALEQGLVSGAGLDLLTGMGSGLAGNPLLNRENVLITPHAAFYTTESLQALQDVSCQNLIVCLQGRHKEADRCVNSDALLEAAFKDINSR